MFSFIYIRLNGNITKRMIRKSTKSSLDHPPSQSTRFHFTFLIRKNNTPIIINTFFSSYFPFNAGVISLVDFDQDFHAYSKEPKTLFDHTIRRIKPSAVNFIYFRKLGGHRGIYELLFSPIDVLNFSIIYLRFFFFLIAKKGE